MNIGNRILNGLLGIIFLYRFCIVYQLLLPLKQSYLNINMTASYEICVYFIFERAKSPFVLEDKEAVIFEWCCPSPGQSLVMGERESLTFFSLPFTPDEYYLHTLAPGRRYAWSSKYIRQS